MAEINDFRKTQVGNHIVECVEMLDSDTCILSFETESDENALVSTQVEYWLDEDKWVYRDVWYDIEGMYLNGVESERLTEEDKNQCKEIIGKYLEQVK